MINLSTQDVVKYVIENWVGLGSVMVAFVSALYARFSYVENKKSYQLSQTPILLPLVGESNDKKNYYIGINNNHDSGIAKNLSLKIFKDARVIASVENEFLIPHYVTNRLEITKDAAKYSFEVKYRNVFNQAILLTGIIDVSNIDINRHLPDLQNIELKIDGITN